MLPTPCSDIEEFQEWLKGPPALYNQRDLPRYEDEVKRASVEDIDDHGLDEWISDFDAKEFPAPATSVAPSLRDRFLIYARKWEEGIGPISSATDLASHPSYQSIIGLGWDVVPLLLSDLQESKRFWFPALHAITGIRPFDLGDAGNSKRMTAAWVTWGKRKGLI